jgi:hypothetical protein
MCLKCTNAVPTILLRLFGDHAKDLTPARASYRYIDVPGAHLTYSFLVLKLTDTEKSLVEELIRPQPLLAQAFLWQDSRWYEFPHGRFNEYRLASTTGSIGYPRFSGDTARSLIPSALTTPDQAPATSTGQITIQRSDREGHGRIWWWIGGVTKPVKDILSSAGARWSRRRQEWYYIGENLPAAIRALETPTMQSNTGVAKDASGPTQQSEKRLHARLTLIKGREFPGSTSFEWAIRGEPTPEQKLLLDKYCHWRDAFTAWFLYEETLPPEIRGIVLVETSQTTSAVGYGGVQSNPQVETPEVTTEANANTSVAQTPAKADPISVIKPQSLPLDGVEPDAIQQAVQEVKFSRLPAVMSVGAADKKTLATIAQQYVGELTGDISGNVHCYGYATHNGIMVYLNLGGPHTAVEAIRAKLGKGQSVNLVPWDGPAVELTAGEGQTGKYKDFMQKIPEAKFTSLILAHELLVAPNYGGKSTTFLIRTSEAQAIARLKQHVTELVNIPVFDSWATYLWQTGQKANLVHPTQSAGEIDLWTVSLDIDDWTRLITSGLEQGVIALPETAK